jgi:hypothetical protein
MTMKRILLAAVCVAALAPASIAQEAATLVLKSGERLSGQLVDMGGVGFTVSIGGAQRTVPVGEVALIEFAGGGSPTLPSDMLARLNNGQHAVVLRNGQAFAGNLYDIGGTSPLRVTIDTESGRRDVTSNEIARIYLAPQGAAGVGTTGATVSPASAGTIVVPANQAWVPTGINVRAGETLNFQTTGEIVLSADPNDKAHSAGHYGQRRPGPGAPLPNAFTGALVGRINNGEVFPIGNMTSVTMPASGQLYLGINDDTLGDNSGQFNVTITRNAGRRRR